MQNFGGLCYFLFRFGESVFCYFTYLRKPRWRWVASQHWYCNLSLRLLFGFFFIDRCITKKCCNILIVFIIACRLRPLTMCQECHTRYHSTGEGYHHVTQNLFPDPWTLQGPDQAYPSEAVIRLLGEAQPCQKKRNEAMGYVTHCNN